MVDFSAPRAVFMYTVLGYNGRPYVFGGDDPSGIDCSGLVMEGFKSCGLVAESTDWTADQMMRELAQMSLEIAGPSIETPEYGDLLFFLDSAGRAYHVVVCLNEHYAIGANGGKSTTKTEEDAWRDNAWVRIRPIRIAAMPRSRWAIRRVWRA